MRFAERERVIGAERDAGCAEKLEQHPQRIGIVHERIDVKARGVVAIGEITSRVSLCYPPRTDPGGHESACSMRPMVKGNAPPPCAKATRSFGKRSKTPPKIMRANRERRFGGHARPATAASISACALCRACPTDERRSRRRVVRRCSRRTSSEALSRLRQSASMTMLIRIDVGADLRAAQTRVREHSAPVRLPPDPDLATGCVARPAKRVRMRAHDFGDVIVQPARKDRARPPASPSS